MRWAGPPTSCGTEGRGSLLIHSDTRVIENPNDYSAWVPGRIRSVGVAVCNLDPVRDLLSVLHSHRAGGVVTRV